MQLAKTQREWRLDSEALVMLVLQERELTDPRRRRPQTPAQLGSFWDDHGLWKNKKYFVFIDVVNYIVSQIINSEMFSK